MSDSCWPVQIDEECCAQWESYSESVKERATRLATATLRMLTGYRVGNCPVRLRPCKQGCGPMNTWATFPVAGAGSWAGASGGGPTVINGSWYNVTCGCGIDNCSCTALCEVVLPGEVASVGEVTLHGVVIDPTAYRIDNGNRLLRTDGGCWPLCQDMTLDTTEPDTFSVLYTPGLPVSDWGEEAAGVLACEYALACTGGKCRLPPNVTQVSRLGVTMTMTQNPFPNGLTGIREVDSYVRFVNPNNLAAPSLVWSPDVQRGRVTAP